MDDIITIPMFDEQGDWYPPGTALAAFLVGYAGESNLDGTLVEVQAFLEEGVFECMAVNGPIFFDGRKVFGADETFYAYPRELRPINKHTQAYMVGVTEAKVSIYEMDVYDIRDKLAEINIHVTAESVASWTGTQRSKIWAYAVAIADGEQAAPPRPKELP